MASKFYHHKLLETARDIERKWRRFDNDCSVFPDLVYQITECLDLTEFGDLSYMLELLDDPYVSAIQKPAVFSDLYLKLYDNGRFWVEILNWWGSDINIHDHDFSGVQFQLTGRSLNVVYGFSEQNPNTHLVQGDIAVVRAEVWSERSRSLVRPGRAEPHNVNHLSMPTVSLLIRTHPVAAFGPQRNYLPPLIAANYGVGDLIFKKRLGGLRLLSRDEPGKFHKTFRHIVASQTATENLFMFSKMVDILFNSDHVHLLKEYADSGDLERNIVQSIAVYRAHDYLNNSIKWNRALTEKDLLVLSILASSWDEASRGAIVQSLQSQNYDINLQASITSILSHLTEPECNQFRNILQLLGFHTSSGLLHSYA